MPRRRSPTPIIPPMHGVPLADALRAAMAVPVPQEKRTSTPKRRRKKAKKK